MGESDRYDNGYAKRWRREGVIEKLKEGTYWPDQGFQKSLSDCDNKDDDKPSKV
jgi:hypothetical protein